jgi:hypothetical protein
MKSASSCESCACASQLPLNVSSDTAIVSVSPRATESFAFERTGTSRDGASVDVGSKDRTRDLRVLWALEEMGVPFEIVGM